MEARELQMDSVVAGFTVPSESIKCALGISQAKRLAKPHLEARDAIAMFGLNGVSMMNFEVDTFK